MIEPRDLPDNMNRSSLRFIGGTENFDLWWRGDIDVYSESAGYSIRIHRVAGGHLNWDVFKLPLRDNHELHSQLEPASRRITGYWNDVTLSWDDVEMIETYLRCFAPWVWENNDAETTI
jgi:hypothetical protein